MMSYQNKGKESQSIGDAFEKEIARTFDAYAAAGIAYLDFVPKPSRTVFDARIKRVILVPTGKPPFDVGGFMPSKYPMTFRGKVVGGESGETPTQLVAVMVGAECKSTREPATSLAIVKPQGDSAGVEHHQLEALALLARMGGIARIVWNNGGEVGILREPAILAAWTIYDSSLATERRGAGRGPVGSRSVKWAAFEKVPAKMIGNVPAVYDWLGVA